MSTQANASVKNVVTEKLTQYQRFELKFYIPSSKIDILVPELLNYLEYDEYSQHDYYPIYNVYFDTYDWQAFDAKMAGTAHRRKFRIRTYDKEVQHNEHLFLEIKEKHVDTVLKRRSPIQYGEVADLVQGGRLSEAGFIPEEWRYNILKNQLKPRVLNTYLRRAFVSPMYPGLRITLDRDVSYAIVNEVTFNANVRPTSWARSISVVEVKFEGYVPLFIVDLLRKYDLSREAISKYGESIMTNYLLIT